MTEGPENLRIIRLATAYRANFSEKGNWEHECKTAIIQPTGDQLDSKDNSPFKTTEDEDKFKGPETDEPEEDIEIWKKAFKRLRPPPKIKRRKPANPECVTSGTCKEILDLIKPFSERSQQKKNNKTMLSESVRRILNENCTSLEFEDDSEFIVHHESNKTPTSPFMLKF